MILLLPDLHRRGAQPPGDALCLRVNKDASLKESPHPAGSAKSYHCAMVETWHVDSASGARSLAADSVALLLDAQGAAEPAGRMLAFLNTVAPVDYLALVEYVPGLNNGAATPELVEGHAAPQLRNVTAECFTHYRKHFWREDEATRIAQQVGSGAAPVTALHFKAGDIHVPRWRSEIYERAQLADRLSFLYSPVPQRAYAINLYRGDSHGAFRTGEIQALLGVAPLLRLAHRSVLCASLPQGGDLVQRVARAASALARKAPELSARERAVCARVACGMSADGIAAELDVAPSSVSTLRKRAYAKLAARGIVAGRQQLAELAS